jgi:hypothetical protein
MGRACGTHGRGEKFTRFWWESPKERDHWEDQRVGGKMGSEWILGRLAWGGVDWIRLAQDRVRWRAVVSAVMNLRVLGHGVSASRQQLHSEEQNKHRTKGNGIRKRKYSGRKITESLGNVTVRGGKDGKSKGGARLSTVCLSMYSITENI